MRKFILPLFFILLTSSIYGQQYLWSTIENDTLAQKNISVDNVNNEIMKFYDHYKYHYDLTGFSKERFLEEMDFGIDDWGWVNDINELTVFAFRSNEQGSSLVMVMFITENNINSIIFSNDRRMSGYNNVSNYDFEKDKFKTWLNTLKD